MWGRRTRDATLLYQHSGTRAVQGRRSHRWDGVSCGVGFTVGRSDFGAQSLVRSGSLSSPQIVCVCVLKTRNRLTQRPPHRSSEGAGRCCVTLVPGVQESAKTDRANSKASSRTLASPRNMFIVGRIRGCALLASVALAPSAAMEPDIDVRSQPGPGFVRPQMLWQMAQLAPSKPDLCEADSCQIVGDPRSAHRLVFPKDARGRPSLDMPNGLRPRHILQ